MKMPRSAARAGFSLRSFLLGALLGAAVLGALGILRAGSSCSTQTSGAVRQREPLSAAAGGETAAAGAATAMPSLAAYTINIFKPGSINVSGMVKFGETVMRCHLVCV